ncbi:MAG: UPF0280 family protein [Rhodospirillales bacterium]
MSAHARVLPDGRRLHLQHGPIDLIIEAWGERTEVEAAYGQAIAYFEPLLETLVRDLPTLRRPVGPDDPELSGPVAARMVRAAMRHRGVFVTPMAAVAGAVADAVLAAMLAGRRLDRAYVNDGGDIALHLSQGQHFKVGAITRLDSPAIDAVARIEYTSPVRGIATSGQGGRSFSFGIADAVTVLAEDAAAADVAATLIANAVSCEAPTIERAPASSRDADSDLGDRLVVVRVGHLSRSEIAAALTHGAAEAERMRRRGLIEAAFLALRGHARVVGGSACPSLTAAPLTAAPLTAAPLTAA